MLRASASLLLHQLAERIAFEQATLAEAWRTFSLAKLAGIGFVSGENAKYIHAVISHTIAFIARYSKECEAVIVLRICHFSVTGEQ